MTPQEKIIALEMLAGTQKSKLDPNTYPITRDWNSYDAIIPLVQKMDDETIAKMYDTLIKLPYKIIHTLSEIADALLKAKGCEI